MASQERIPSFYECSPLLGFFVCKKRQKNCRLDELSPDINKYVLKRCIHHSNNTNYSQILIIAPTSKALDLLLKQSLLGIVVFYTQKTHSRGEHS